ncbi:MAG: KpsF/GutQ family sugar-phosphate isomerase [Alphaproteobacteria bacterium]|jgi:arabinose-5-phosphate isomerase|nr:KpsF/GutQ family sugar-phosphate isomerase [Alphaproteobacteria bacterium]
MKPVESARHMAEIYTAAIERFAANLNENFSKAVDLIYGAEGHVVVCGMGKSGLFGRKISSTLASTGTPSIFLHPAEAIHGDLGKVRRGEVVIMISNSGETEEIIRLLPAFKRLEAPIIALTGNASSTLGKHADTVLDISVDREACPLNLAPTTSGLMTLVVGDALAIALMEKRNFKPEDFAATHPGGALGRRLLSTVGDTMIRDNLPFVSPDEVMKNVIVTMTHGRLGIAIVGTPEKLEGIITDGDLRRAMVDNIDISTATAEDLMTRSVLTTYPNVRMVEAEERMQEARVQCLVVTEENGEVVGVVQIF